MIHGSPTCLKLDDGVGVGVKSHVFLFWFVFVFYKSLHAVIHILLSQKHKSLFQMSQYTMLKMTLQMWAKNVLYFLLMYTATKCDALVQVFMFRYT